MANQILSKIRLLKGIYLIVLIFCASYGYSQSAIGILDLYHESFRETRALTVTTNARIGDYAFHTNVGGISSQAVASPSSLLENESVSLDFENNRMIVRIGNKTIYPNLPTWQLVPIVKFADSPYNVAVSQLGDTTGNQGAECRFHPAFLDNLLGLRLLQADMLNLTDILWDLPIDAQRRYILAPSEQGFRPNRDSILHRTLYEKLYSGRFTSYVLTDKDVNVVFDIDGSNLTFSGKPYYYFLRTELDTANIRQIRAKLIKSYNDIDIYAKVLLKEKYTPDLNPRTNLGSLVEMLAKQKQEQVFNPYSMHYIENAINELTYLNSLTDEEIGIQFQFLDDYSESFRPYWDYLKRYNPLVFSTVENTFHWSAFFRYVIKNNPSNWSIFVEKVENNSNWDAPPIQTPTSTDINYFRYFDEKEKAKW